MKSTNITVSKSFSERFEVIVDRYHNRNDQDDVIEVFEELLKFKQELEEAIDEGKQLGLSYEEKAFFDVLGADPDIKKLLEDEILIEIAKDLSETVKRHRTHDWARKQQAQARMRLQIKMVLRRHGYPPKTKNRKQWKKYWSRRSCRRRGCRGTVDFLIQS